MKKREYMAFAVLLTVLLLSLWNIRKVDEITDSIIICLEKSQSCAEELDMRGAGKNLDEALKIWLSAENYTHIFIRHSEIDSATDAFYELKQELGEPDMIKLKNAYEKLKYHIAGIDLMEHPSIGSIL